MSVPRAYCPDCDHGPTIARRGASKLHPDFSSMDCDVVLRSLEGTLYRVDSQSLRTSSELFDTILSLPQPQTCGCVHKENHEIPVYELDVVLEPLLHLLCHLALPPYKTYEEFERLLMVAEKWVAVGAIESLREALAGSSSSMSDPLRVYVLARHFEWREDAKLAATQTLQLDLRESVHASALAELSSHEILPLLDLHRTRRELFRTLLDSPARFTIGNRSCICPHCGMTELDNSAWEALKDVLLVELERRPLGDTLESIFGETLGKPEAKACWEARCRGERCGEPNYDKSATIRQIKNCLDLLPLTIEN